jgi:transcriptional regulator with XRE-family HTH domain
VGRVKSSKLTDELVKYIRLRVESGVSQSALARRFKVSRQTVNNVALGYTYRDVSAVTREERQAILRQFGMVMA